MTVTKLNEIDYYILSFPEETAELLAQLRTTIKSAAPEAEEMMSYGMPAFRLHRMLVYYSGYKNHIGFYPGVSGIEAFKSELTDYKNSKGAVQFPLNQSLPLDLITRMVKFRVNENLQKTKIG